MSFLNLVRLTVLFLAILPIYIFNKNRAIYLFLKIAGPSFIKLGQILAVRPDLVGDKLANNLAKFQDKLDPFSDKKLQKILQQEYNNFDQIFSEFDNKAVASASIAQVHKAKLANNKLVAVKVLRPNITKIIRRDVKTLRFIAILIRIFSKFLHKTISDLANLLENVARSETNLLKEAANASRLRENLQDLEGFYVPEVFWQYSTTKILVLEWIDGLPFSNKEQITKTKFNKEQIAKNLVISYFTQVYEYGFFHADMHPGNLFLMKNGSIGVVDFGIMAKIDKKTRIAIAEILIGFLNKDYQKVAQLHIDANLVPETTEVDDLALSCRKIGEGIIGLDVKDISIAKLLENLITMTRDYNMDTRLELLLLQKTILLVEGIGVSLDPNLNIWNLARPWIANWAKSNIGFDAKIRDAIHDFIEIGKKLLRQFK